METRPWHKHYDPEVPHEIEIPEITLVTLFKHAVDKMGDSTCMIFNNQQKTYRQVDFESNQVARYLLDKGLAKGDRVGIMLPNIPEFVISYYGILKAGGVVMSLNPAYCPYEVEKLLNESGVKILILNKKAYDKFVSIRSGTAVEACVVLNAEPDTLLQEDLEWESLSQNYEGIDLPQVALSPNNPAVFQYSGGTTGTPKCAVGLHRNLVANVYQFSYWLGNPDPGTETVLVAIPLYHVYGMVLGMNLAVKMGAKMVLIENPTDFDTLLNAIEQYSVTIFPGVPNLYAAINRYPAVLAGDFELASIKACISGSATLPLKVKQAFEELTKGHLVEGYGLSEAPTATHCNPVLGENRENAIGLPLPNVDCRIVDLQTGEKTLKTGEIGELVVRGPQVMEGYYLKPEETAYTIRDGWLFTGDVARMDKDGYFYLVDRKKDVIKVGGFQVWPNEIEAVIRQHPKVCDVAVAGVLDEDGAEVVKAWIVLHENEGLDSVGIQDFCRKFLTHYKIPKFIEFRESLPRTRVGKVLRRVLVEEHRI